MPKKETAAWMPPESLETNLRSVLPALIAAYYKAGRKAAAAKKPGAALHRFRLKTKRIRYTLELFREISGPAFGERLDTLRPIQTALGDINDCITTRTLLTPSELKLAAAFLTKRERSRFKEFQTYWTKQFDKPGVEAAWIRYAAKLRIKPGTSGMSE